MHFDSHNVLKDPAARFADEVEAAMCLVDNGITFHPRLVATHFPRDRYGSRDPGVCSFDFLSTDPFSEPPPFNGQTQPAMYTNVATFLPTTGGLLIHPGLQGNGHGRGYDAGILRRTTSDMAISYRNVSIPVLRRMAEREPQLVNEARQRAQRSSSHADGMTYVYLGLVNTKLAVFVRPSYESAPTAGAEVDEGTDTYLFETWRNGVITLSDEV